MSDFGQIIIIIGFIALAVFLAWFFIFKVKHLKTPDVFLVDGGVKTGKSLLSVCLVIRQYRKNLIRYYVGNFLGFFLKSFKTKLIPFKKKLPT